MKLLFAYPFCGLGGVETSILNKIDALAMAGVQAHALFGDFYGSGSRSLADHPRVTISRDAGQIRALIGQGFDVISIIDHPEFVDALEAHDTEAVTIAESHASFLPALPRLHRNLNHHRIAAIVVPSGFNRELVKRSLHWTKPVLVIRNPVDGARFRPAIDQIQPPVAAFTTGPMVLWIGRLEDQKNPAELMEIAVRLLPSRPDVGFLVLGDAWSPEEYAAHRQRLLLSLPEKWRSQVRFHRSLPYDAMPGLYAWVAQTGGCLVSTSLFESVPMTFIEAMSCGCPVVSTRVGGASELLADGKAGRLYEVGRVDDGARAILDLLDEDKRVARATLVRDAQGRAAERHSPETVGREYRELLQSLTGNQETRSRRPARPRSTAADVPDRSDVIPGLVSTIVPVYNRSGLLREAVGSVLAQTYREVEVIIVDDGSTDDTAEVCDRLAVGDERVRVLHVPHQGRAGLAREVGRGSARGEFIQYLDSDDVLYPRKFEVMVGALTGNPDCDIAYCYTRRYVIGSTPTDSPSALTGHTFRKMFPSFLSRRYWQTSTPIYRRHICDTAGPWSDLLFWEDIEYDTRIASQDPRLHHCREWLTDMRDHHHGRLSGSRFLDDPTLLREAVRGMALLYEDVERAGWTYDLPEVRRFIDDVRVLHARCRRFELEEEAGRCITILERATGESDPRRLTDYSVGAVVEPQQGSVTLQPRHSSVCAVRVTNTSTVAFHDGELATSVSYHLRRCDGVLLQFETPIRAIFEEPLDPGESRVVDVWIQAPESCGLYYVELDVLWAECGWLNAMGSPAAFVKLLVTDTAIGKRWWLNTEGGASGEMIPVTGDSESLKLSMEGVTGTEPWHVQLNRESFSLHCDNEYILKLRARADRVRGISVGVAKAHEPWTGLGLYRQIELSRDWQSFELPFRATESEERARVHVDAGAGTPGFVELADVALYLTPGHVKLELPPFALPGRLQMDIGTEPASSQWGTDRGLAVHRYYLEQFLAEFAADIRGTCLEFQDPQYTPRFGGRAVKALEILHVDDSNPRATLVADLTVPNDLPSNYFDCILCTHVLHVIRHADRAVAELFRILKPDGVLLVAVPHFSMFRTDYGEIWRFTPRSLEILLSGAFANADILIRSFGNSLTAAGEIRGAVATEFLKSELDHNDPRFPVEVCAHAVKRMYR
jgi:glycosyltransferase involved in cell wall biosynthesis/SAM-dependent methyltransferase